jgi:hypothetical protein
MVVLSAGIRSLLWTKERTPNPGNPGMVGDIISERWARSSRRSGFSRNRQVLMKRASRP